ncbi:hypothetical protein EUX98_g2013 [Antrodiella citrinella]|uniref:HD/PDEase domain-containing protein n=1 Tax=Antrodiella citrinella TaxID=2447956 RepID=A0A4S4N8E9_9APHY|nr:hypothetical protein EUX98_g2013 [Antrodiella citrinella]
MDFDSPSASPEPVLRPMAVAQHDRSFETRRFKDPLYDYMPFGQRVCSIIDTKHFQRLRRVKQLGTSYYVWPTACHNRFEHCLGVAHLAQTLAKHLQTSQPELGITDEEVDCVAIAGLCHDLGHGPWSHVWDGLFIPQAIPGSTWQHEHASEMMFDDLVQEYSINLAEDEIVFIKALIAGEQSRCKGFQVKPYLFEIVANKRNGLDVDKFDYIARDSQAVGMANISGLTRLLDSSRVIDNQICYNIKDVNQVYQVCYTRFLLHKTIYNHKTAKAVEHMIIDGLIAAEPFMKIAERIQDPKQFLHLTDNIQDKIEESTAPELEPARAIFDRISSRNLYKMVDFNIILWKDQKLFKEQFTPERIVDAVKRHTFTEKDEITPENVAALSAKDIIVDLSPMHYGMKDKNPLDFVKFYSKRSPNVSQHAGPGDISLLMPQTFGEVLLRVFTRRDSCFGLVQTGWRDLLEELEKKPDEFESKSIGKTRKIAKLDLEDSEAENDEGSDVAPVPRLPALLRTKRPLGRIASAPLPPTSMAPEYRPKGNPFMTVGSNFTPRGAKKQKKHHEV